MKNLMAYVVENPSAGPEPRPSSVRPRRRYGTTSQLLARLQRVLSFASRAA
jgi:hypothetical protein